MGYYIAPPPMNPVSRILAGLVGILVLVGAFFFGLVVLAAAIGVAVLAWLFIVLRMWWLRRRWGSQFAGSGTVGADRSAHPERRENEVIDADYEVISRREDD
jgi:uncharacterized membrane protein